MIYYSKNGYKIDLLCRAHDANGSFYFGWNFIDAELVVCCFVEGYHSKRAVSVATIKKGDVQANFKESTRKTFIFKKFGAKTTE